MRENIHGYESIHALRSVFPYAVERATGTPVFLALLPRMETRWHGAKSNFCQIDGMFSKQMWQAHVFLRLWWCF